MVAMPRVPVRREKRAPAADRAAAKATGETRGFAPDRYGPPPAERYSPERYGAERYGEDRYDGYGKDRYQADRSAVEDRYGATADDLAAAAGRGPMTRPPGGRRNGTPAKANGTAASGTPASGTTAATGSANGTGAADPAVEAATDDPTRRITRPAVD
jgi:hypothetical protein